MSPQHACPNCRAALPRGVANCPECGSSLDGLLEMPDPGDGNTTANSLVTKETATHNVYAPSEEALDSLDDSYQVVQRYPLQTCTFYQATHREHDDSYLVRQTKRPRPLAPTLREPLEAIIREEIPHLLKHVAVHNDEHSSYVVLRHPGSGWRSLSLMPAPVGLQAALEWARQAGSVLQALARRSLGSYPPGLAGREGFIVDQKNDLYLADLTLCHPLQEDEVAASRSLASLLYYLTTGQDLPTHEQRLSGAPDVLRPILQSAIDGQSLDDFVEALEDIETPLSAAPRRALRQLAGNSTDTGRKRSTNEDWVGALSYTLDRTGESIPLGLYIVADGMGGYAGGEHASSNGIRQPFMEFVKEEIMPHLQNVTRRLSPDLTPEGKLQAMVKLANERVYENRRRSGDERGSTMTAAMILGSTCVVANVGDSRTYLYRDRQLRQITEDHSLVARLVQAGEIEPDDIYTHPDRNQIYRSLGNRPEVPIDTFTIRLQAGDRLLLCSDGLWEMVRDPQIATILADNANPQLICDHLVMAANQNGGEDNISAIVIDLH